MKKDNKSTAATLRQKAEELLKKKPLKTVLQLSESETMKLIHELQVHQIELELQNEELILAKEQAEVATQKYVTERKLAEEERLGNSEERFRLLYENAKIGLYRTTPDGTIVLANKALVAMLGYQSFDELAKRNIEHDGFETPQQRKAFLETIEQTGEVENFETTWIRKDRTPVFVRESARAIRDSLGNTIYYDGTAEDITQLKHTQDELNWNMALLEAKANFSTPNSFADAIVVVDPQGKKIFQNQAATDLLNFPRYIADKKDDEGELQWVAGLTKDPGQFIERIVYLNSHPDEISREVIEYKNGTILDRYTAPVVGKDGKYYGRLWIFHDITERRRTKEALLTNEKRLREFNELQGLLLPPNRIELKLKLITDAVVRIMGADFARIWMIKPGDRCEAGCIHAQETEGAHTCRFQDRCLHLMVSSGSYTHTNGQVHARVPFGCYKIGKIAAGEETKFLTNNVTTDPRVHDNAWAKELGLVSFAGYRLVDANGTPLGVLALFSKQAISEEDDSFLEGIAHSTSRVLHSEWVEAALRDSETRYHLLFEKSADGILIADVETKKFKYANSALCRMLGYTEEELKTLGLADIHPSKDLPRVIAEFESQARGEKVLAPDIPCLRKDGSIMYADINTSTNIMDGKLCAVGLFRDITERKQAEEALRQSEIKLQVILESTADGILAIDGNGKVIKTNNRFAELWKIPPSVLNSGDDATLLNFVLEQLINPKQFLDKVQQLYNSTDEDSDTLFFKDGRIFERYSAPLILDEKIIGRVWSFRDITARKQAEEALRESKNIIQNIIDNSPSLIYILDLDGKFILANKKLAEVLNCSAEKLLGNTRQLIMPKEFADQHRNNDLQVISTKQPAICEEEIRESDGLHIYLTQKFPLFDSEGKIYAVGGISTDITERKKSEERINMLALAVKNSADCIAITDKDYKIIFVNDSFSQVYGFEKEEIVGQQISVITSKNNLPEVGYSLYSAMDRNEVWTGEVLNRRKDGNDFPVQLSLAPVITEKGELIAIVGVVRDITERKQAEEALRNSEQRYRLLIETVNEGILVAQNGFLKFVNPMMQVITGFTQEELLSLPFINYVHPDDRETVISNHLKRLKGDPFLPRYQFRIVKKDESIRRIEMNGIVIEWEGQPATLNMLTDITERTQAEEALQNERTLLRTVIDNVPDLIYSKDQLCRKTLANLADVLHTGARSEAEVIGKDDFAFHPKEIAEKFFADDQSVIQTGEPLLNKEEYAIDDKGQKKWLVTSKFPLRNERDQIIGLVGITHDITKRKQEEEIIERSEMKFRTLFESANDAIFLVKEDTFVDCNFKTEQMFQCSRAEILNRHPYEFSPPFQPDGSDSKLKALEKINAALSGTPQSFEWKHQKLDGTPFDAEVSLNRINIDGKVLLQAIVRDISEHKQAEEALRESEERFRRLFELSPEAIVLIDPYDTNVDWPIVDCNETACKMNGYTREELIGKSIDIVNPTPGTPEERAEYLDKLRHAPVLHLEAFHRHRDGHIFPIDVSTSIETFLGREMVLGIDRDITERKQAEEEIRLKNEQLLKINTEKDKFFSIISHDLRGPFSGFLGLTELMAEDLSSLTMDQIQEFSLDMRNSAANLYRLLENLLQWSRMQQGSIPFDPEVIQLRSIVDECMAIALEPAKNKGIDLTTDIPENLKVVADNNMLQTVVRNLVSNAQKFTRKGGKISVSAKATENKNVEISVKDSGIGMNPEMVGNLFRLDVKTNRKGTNNEPSTGLGLLLCKEFVEKQGGKIWVESEEGKGTTFYFTLQMST
jgi:PAS domain S-box-containing protein